MGITTRNAIAAFKKEGDPRKCGAYGEWDNGNGSLMRILPLAFLDVTDGQVAEVSALTHGHKRSVTGCLHYLTVARALLKGADKRQALALLEGQCEGALRPTAPYRLPFKRADQKLGLRGGHP